MLHGADSPKNSSTRILNFIKIESEPKLHAERQNSTGVRTLPRLIRSVWGSKNRSVGSDLLAEEHTTTCLIDDTISQPAEVFDLSAQLLDGHVGEHVLAAHRAGPLEPRACVSYDLLGNVDEHPVCVGLLLVTLPRRHALDLVHPPPRRACAVAKPLDSS